MNHQERRTSSTPPQDENARVPVPPKQGDPEALLRHIAEMKDCQVCFPHGWRGMEERTGLCSRHRDPILLANGYVSGWTHRGGWPQNMTAGEGVS